MDPSVPPSRDPRAGAVTRFSIGRIVSPAILTFALFSVLIFAVIIPAMRRNIIDRKKETIRELTQAAWSELEDMHRQEREGALTREAAQQAAIARIRSMRYGADGKDYFWLSDTQPRLVMHPYRPDLEGQSLRDYADPAGKRLFVEFTRVVGEQGAGYVDYLWQWKDDEQRVVPKLSYVKGFAPWGWIVGTGVYLEDVRAEVRRVIDRILLVSLGISGVIAALLVYIGRQGVRLDRERRRAEAALRASEEKYRLLVEGTTEGVLMVLDDRPVYANRTLLERLGYTEAELADLPLGRIVEPVSARHARLLGRDGRVADVQLTVAPVQIGGRPGQVLSLTDVTAHRQAEADVRRLQAELQAALPLTTRPVKDLRLSRVACSLDTPIGEAAAAMARAQASAILVQAPGGEPVGIVTDRDLRDRVVAAGRAASQPVAQIMSAPLVRVPEQARLFEAAHLMQERELQHLVVTDASGAATGVLAGAEILYAQRHAVGLLLGDIARAASPAELRACQARLAPLVKTLLDGGTRVEHVTRIMSSVADAVTVRLMALAEAALGPPPAPYAFVALGSEARGEQTLATDQDNAIVYADGADAQAYFLRLGARVCEGLDLAGYRRCPGAAMACNPKWCQPLRRWQAYFADCVAAASPQDLLDVNVFFDFRCVHGDAGLVTQLRQHLRQALAPGQPVFFFHLAQSTLRFKPPRGFFGNIQLESGGAHPATFNIKSALIPLVNFARLYALRHDLAETNTLERLAALRDRGVLRPASQDELAQAYTALMQIRLAHQVAQAGRGAPPDNHIELAELTHLERSMLKKVFADIAVFQARLETDFARTA